jgi:arylsulfatase
MRKEENKPFFVWMNPTRAHVLIHLSPKYDAMRTPGDGLRPGRGGAKADG